MMFQRVVMSARKEEQGQEMKLKDKDGNMLVEENEVRQKWAEYFDEQLHVEHTVQASTVAVGGNRKMHVFGNLNDGGVESYEVEEGMGKMKGGKATGFDQYVVEFQKKVGRSMVV